MKKKIVSLIPELNLIKELKLREATGAVLLEAMEQGGWKLEDLDKIPFTLLIKDCKISFLKHTRGVVNTCIQAAKVIKEFYGDKAQVNQDFLVSGAILHDVGKLLEYKRDGAGFTKSHSGEFLRHPFSGTGIAYGKGIPAEVLHMIAVHAKEGDGCKRSPEAVILHHADFTNFEIFH
jgi:putative nucleotidyltransferase with HDIG domain